MSAENERLVTEFCQAFLEADIAKLLTYLSEDIVYQNMPWKPVTGHEEVRKVLTPFIHGANCALTGMEITHTTSSGNVVMNERLENWQKGAVSLDLPVMGVFEIEDGKIAKWRDYFDGPALTPLMEAVQQS